MKKKILVTALALILVIGLMTGCSTSEIGYLNMMKDSMNMKSAEVSGTMDIKVDLQETAKYAEKFLGVDAAKDFNEAIKTIGANQEMKMNYSGKVSMSNPFGYDLNMSLVYKGKTVDFGNMTFEEGKGMYVSTNFLTGSFELLNLFETNDKAKTVGNDIIAAIKKDLGTSSYIQLASAEEMTIPGMSFDQLYAFGQPEVDFITNAFKDYTTGKITATADGYTMSLTLNDLFTMCSGILDYVAKNDQALIKAVETYAASSSGSKMGLTDEMVKELVAAMKENSGQIKTLVTTLKTGLDEIAKEQVVKDFAQSYYKLTSSKTSNGIKGQEELSVIANGKTLMSLKAESTSVSKDVKIASPTQNIVTMDAATDKYAKTINSATMATAAAIEWTSKDEFADVEYSRDMTAPFWAGVSNFDSLEFRMKDGSIYLPLRSISESFGEEVGWDNKAKKAYIVKDGKQVMMEGLLSPSTVKSTSLTFVKIRDFEKLGYKVDYVYDKDTKTHLAKLAK